MKRLKSSKVNVLKRYPTGMLEFMQRIEQPFWLKTIVSLRVILKKSHPEFNRALRHASLNVDLIQTPNTEVPNIVVLMTVHPKDNMRVGFAIDTLKKYSINKIDEFTLITTEDNVSFLNEMFGYDGRFRIVSEEQSTVWLLINELKAIGDKRYGHILQQLLKIWHSVESKSNFILVFDSDTFLTRPTLWVNSELQSGIFPTFHASYADKKTKELYPNFVNWSTKECYISHHLVFNRRILSSFLKELGEFPSELVTNSTSLLDQVDADFRKMFCGLINYARLGHDMSEYDSYSKYAFHNYSAKVEELRWSNLTLFMEDFEVISAYLNNMGPTNVEDFIKKFRSISVHDHR